MIIRTWLALMVGILLLLLLTGTAPAADQEIDLTRGAWKGEGGPETFVLRFTRQDGKLTGMIHTLRDGMKLTELPVQDIHYDHPHLTLQFPHGPTYEGEVDGRGGLIEGAVMVGGERAGEMPLQWVDPASIPQLDPGLGRYVDAPYTYRVPTDTADRWQVGPAPETVFPPDALEQLVRGILEGRAGVIHALLVAQSGKLVLEEYFHGSGRDYQHGVASVTKSVSSLLAGIALEQGKIASLQTPLPAFFPDCRPQHGQDWSRATLEHLLTMSLGLDWDAGQMHGLHGTGPDFFCHVLDRGFRHAPGSHWSYVNADVNLLAGVIKQATGAQADRFAAEHLFGPLGIEHWNWGFMKEDGYPLMDGSLRLRARDMLTLGQLMLMGGTLDGKHVVSPEWVEASLSPQIVTGEPEDYGYLWWILKVPVPGGELAVPAANGWGSQFILILPHLDAVIVTQGGNQENGKHMAVLHLLAECLGES